MKYLLRTLAVLTSMTIGTILSFYFAYIVKDLADAFLLTYIQELSLNQVYGYAFVIGMFAAMPSAISRLKKINDINEKLIGKKPFADKMAESFAMIITSGILLSLVWLVGHIVAKIIM